jgi:hypothetical protein
MANGELIEQIDQMLELGTIPAKACSRITLQLLRDMYKKQTELDDKMDKIYPVYRFTLWIGGALGVSVVAMIWGILTHQVTILW